VEWGFSLFGGDKMVKLANYLAKALQIQLDRAGYHFELSVLQAWILTSLRGIK